MGEYRGDESIAVRWPSEPRLPQPAQGRDGCELRDLRRGAVGRRLAREGRVPGEGARDRRNRPHERRAHHRQAHLGSRSGRGGALWCLVRHVPRPPALHLLADRHLVRHPHLGGAHRSRVRHDLRRGHLLGQPPSARLHLGHAGARHAVRDHRRVAARRSGALGSGRRRAGLRCHARATSPRRFRAARR